MSLCSGAKGREPCGNGPSIFKWQPFPLHQLSGDGLLCAVKLDLNTQQDSRTLSQFQSTVQQCVANRGLGLTADVVDHCNLILKYPQGTNSTWYNAQFKVFEPLQYKFNVCEALLLWEQGRIYVRIPSVGLKPHRAFWVQKKN